VPPFNADPQAARPMMPSQNIVPTPLAQPAVARTAAETIPDPVRSSPLTVQRRGGPQKLPLGLLIGVAAAFLVVGAILAAVVMKMVMK
jgi:hypothetical protein